MLPGVFGEGLGFGELLAVVGEEGGVGEEADGDAARGGEGEPELFGFAGRVAVGDGFGGEEGEGGDGGQNVVGEFGFAEGEENDDDEGPDPEVDAEVAGVAGPDFEVVPFGFEGAGEPGGEGEGDDEGEIGAVEIPRDGVGDVAALEAADVLLDEEFLEEGVGVGEVGGDVPSGDDGEENCGSGEPGSAEGRSEIGESPIGEGGEEAKEDEGDGALGEDGDSEEGGGAELEVGFLEGEGVVVEGEREGEGEDEGGVGHHHAADGDDEEAGSVNEGGESGGRAVEVAEGEAVEDEGGRQGADERREPSGEFGAGEEADEGDG